jgi:hypothetical protein
MTTIDRGGGMSVVLGARVWLARRGSEH